MFSDTPIDNYDNDLLNRRPLAERIAEIILSRDSEHSVVMALQGPWGSGKSSVFRLVEKELEAQAVVLWYEPWFYTSPEQMIVGYLNIVRKALSKAAGTADVASKAKELLRDYGALLSYVPGIGKDVSELGAVSPEELRDKIGKLTRESKQRIVVVVDDVDRLPADEMALLFKLVRLCGFPYFTYLLAFDKQVVQKALLSTFQGDSDFVEKIVQVEIPLPPVDDLILRRFVGQHLDDASQKNGRDSREHIEELLMLDDLGERFHELREQDVLFASLREAKRYLNAVETTLPLVSADIHLYDFFALEYVRIFLPAFYDEIYRLRYSLAGTNWGGERQQADREAILKKLGERILQDDRGTIGMRLLCEVFPLLDAAVNSPNQSCSSKPLPVWARELRARHPELVDRYFYFQIPANSVSHGEVRTLLESINANHDILEESIESAVKRYRMEGRMRGFSDSIGMESGLLSNELRERFAIAAGSISVPIEEPSVELLIDPGEILSLFLIVASMLREMTAEEQRKAAGKIVREAPQLRNAVFFFYMAKPDEAYQAPLPLLDIGSLHSDLVARLRAAFVEGGQNFFDELPVDWLKTLMMWNQPDVMTPVVASCLKDRPADWAKLASLSTDRDHNRSRALNLSVMTGLLNIRVLAESAKEAPLVKVDEGDQEVVEKLLSLLCLVPNLVAELHNIQAVAKAMERANINQKVDVDWRTLCWDRWKDVLKEWWEGKSWWPDMEHVYKGWAGLQALTMQVIEGQPGGKMALAAHDHLNRTALELAEAVQNLVSHIDAEMERLPRLPIDSDFDRH